MYIYIYIIYYTHVEFFIRSSLGNSSEGFVTALSEWAWFKVLGKKTWGSKILSIVTRDSPTWIVCCKSMGYKLFFWKCISAKHHTTQQRNITLSRLRKGSKEREVQAGENFSYIASFSHKLYRITVSQISPKARLETVMSCWPQTDRPAHCIFDSGMLGKLHETPRITTSSM